MKVTLESKKGLKTNLKVFVDKKTIDEKIKKKKILIIVRGSISSKFNEKSIEFKRQLNCFNLTTFFYNINSNYYSNQGNNNF